MQDEAFENLLETAQKYDEAVASTEMVDNSPQTHDEPTDTPSEPVQEPVNTEMGNQADEPNLGDKPQETVTTVDYNEWLKNESGGLFDSVDTFKASLDKFKGYDEKIAKIEQLEKNQLPEDEFVKQLAKMHSEGATKDQLTQFVKINTEFDDFSTLTPEQRMVAKLVLVDGFSKETAQRTVSKQYDFSDLEEGSDDYIDLKEHQRVASAKDLEALNKYKASISTVANNEEAKRLEGIALKSAHEANVRQSIPSFLDKFNGIGSLDLDGKVGAHEVKVNLSFDFDEDYKKSIPQKLESFFNEEIAPITPERIEEANNYIKAEYLLNNYQRLLHEAYKTGLAKAAEITDNKYVNNTKIEEVTKDTPSVDATMRAQMQEMEESFRR